MRYYRIRLDGGRSHKCYFDWLSATQQIGNATVDFASDNVRLVKTIMSEDELRNFCSKPKDRRRKSFADDVEIEEITRANALEPTNIACTQTIQRYFDDFHDIDADD